MADQESINPKREREDGAGPSNDVKRVKTEGAKVKIEKNGQGSQNKPIVISDVSALSRGAMIIAEII
jgi:hypothetical protein